MTRPPRLAERLLAWAMRGLDTGPYLAADLEEEFHAITERDPAIAVRWYWRQCVAVFWRFGLRRRPTRPQAPALFRLGGIMRSDLVLATRSLAKRPLFAAAVVFTIGGAIAATSVGFGVVDGVLLRPLPFATPERLVTIWEQSTGSSAGRGQEKNVVSPANYDTWRRELRTVEDLTAVFETSAALTGEAEPAQVGVVYTAGPLFSLLGGTPLIGRFYGAPEDAPENPSVAVISERLWRGRFGADPGIIGRRIVVNGSPREVVGVLPAALDFAPAKSWGGVGSRDLYIPIQFPPAAWTATGRYLQVVGRLAPNATLESLRSEAVGLTDRLRPQFPERLAGWTVNPVLLKEDIVGDVQTPLLIAFLAVALVLLVACANVANLLLVRSIDRRTELAVRSALGAGRWSLARQVFGESALLAIVGGVVGVALSAWGLTALVASAPDLPRAEAVHLDGRLLGFLGLATVVVAVLIGVGPAVAATGGTAAGWLVQRGGVGDRRQTRARQLLVGAQVALSVVLVITAGLLGRSLINRFAVDLGFNPSNTLSAELSLRGERYRDAGARVRLVEQLADRVQTIPGVKGVSVTSIVPMSDKGQATSFTVLDRPPPPRGQEPVADVRFVDHRYFATMGIALEAGRFLEPSDRAEQSVVALINRLGAQSLWPNESAVGKRIRMEWGDTLNAEIVGVVGDVRLNGPDQPLERPTLYWDYRQTRAPSDFALVVRGERRAPDIGPLRAALGELDPNLPLYNVRTMVGLRADSVARARFIALSLGVFSLLALGLAAVGVYGVTAHGIQQRNREIGVRLALGADRRTVLRMLLVESARVVAPGLLVGLVVALAVSRLLRTMVFGVSATDPLTVVGGLLLMTGVAAAACWLPARRGAALPPADAIRAD